MIIVACTVMIIIVITIMVPAKEMLDLVLKDQIITVVVVITNVV